MTIVAAVQMNSGDDVKENLKSAEKLIQKAVASGANLIVLPEMFATFFEQQKKYTKSNMVLG